MNVKRRDDDQVVRGGGAGLALDYGRLGFIQMDGE